MVRGGWDRERRGSTNQGRRRHDHRAAEKLSRQAAPWIHPCPPKVIIDTTPKVRGSYRLPNKQVSATWATPA
ncbi:MAG: hypothetical protein WAM30_21155 [Candidatus Dormiibacterota bacterium]